MTEVILFKKMLSQKTYNAALAFTLLYKAKMYAISSNTHQLQFIKLHHFKQERLQSI